MNKNGLDTYESDAKKQSRRIIAEELFRRVKHPAFSTVLYLPGPHDYQRKSLLNIGFKNENIFGVDLGANVQAVRDRGGYCIEGKLHEVIDNWPTHRCIDVILADLCCGLGGTALETVRAIGCLYEKQKCAPIVYMNLQRGRDADTNGVREFLKGLRSDSYSKHRVLQLIMWQYSEFGIHNKDALHRAFGNDGDAIAKHACEEIDMMKIRMWDYKNAASSVVMDSMIFQWPRWLIGEKRDAAKVTTQRIAATLATATRRRNERIAA